MAVVELLGRGLLAIIFLLSGFGKIIKFSSVAEDMAQHRVPLPEAALLATILIEIFGGVAIALGFKTRVAAAVVAAWLAVVTLVYHTSLVVPQSQDQTIHFLKNLAILGGLLGLAARGPGSISLDARPRRNRLEV
ncbi:MAG: DoxX family protein [Candidatus Binatia bacterium]|nr:DoxX family protein [Candidatus Binatia bacterium]